MDSSLTPGLYIWLGMVNSVVLSQRVFGRYVELKYIEVIKSHKNYKDESEWKKLEVRDRMLGLKE